MSDQAQRGGTAPFATRGARAPTQGKRRRVSPGPRLCARAEQDAAESVHPEAEKNDAPAAAWSAFIR